MKAKQEGLMRIMVQSDCKKVVDKIKERGALGPVIGTIVEDIWKLKQSFSKCHLSFIKRGKVAMLVSI